MRLFALAAFIAAFFTPAHAEIVGEQIDITTFAVDMLTRNDP